MPFIEVVNCAQVNLVYSLFGQEVENTLYFQYPSLPTDSDLAALANDINTWAADNLLPQLSNDIALVRVVATDLTSESGGQQTFTNTTPVAGGKSNQSLPGNCAFCVSFRSGFRGRSFRGRNYVAGLAEQDIVDNDVSSALAGVIVAAYEELLGLFEGGVPDWVIASRFHDGAPRDTGLTTPVSAVVATDFHIDSQRRRLTSRGR